MNPELTESQFQGAVVQLAELCGWRTNHVFRSVSQRDGGGWRTATTTTGWPDLTLWRPGQFLMVELKAERGRLTTEQRDVIDSLVAAGVDARTWFPKDWPEIQQTLRTKAFPHPLPNDRVKRHPAWAARGAGPGTVIHRHGDLIWVKWDTYVDDEAHTVEWIGAVESEQKLRRQAT
jgi:hypothetical protein